MQESLMNPLLLLRTPEFRRFLLAGSLNTLFSYGLYLFLDLWLPYAAAYVLAYATSLVLQFSLFSRFVYRQPVAGLHLWCYPLLHLCIGSFGTLVLWGTVHYTGLASHWAGLVAIVAQTPVAYFATRWWFSSSTAPIRLQAILLRLLSAVLLGLALLVVISTVLAIAHMGFRVPLWDQFRSYQHLLEQPFPLNVLMSENGHRPIFPNLLKLLDLWVTGGRQWLLLGSGLLLALSCWVLLVRAIWREWPSSSVLRAALLLAASMALFWLGNARMLLHGNEAIAVYWVVGCLLLGLYGLTSERRAWGMRWTAAAIVLGCFGFGNGPVVGCTLLLAAVLLHRSWREVAALSLVFLLTLLLYTVVLPGAGTDRTALTLQPLDNLAVALRWLSGVWIQAWLGLSDDPSGILRGAMLHQESGTWLVSSADWLASWFTEPRQAHMYVALRLGAFGVALLAVLSFWCWRQRLRSRLLLLGLGMAWFALGTALLIGMSRYAYFQLHPAQIFAERYLPWSCVFWLGLLLAATAGLRQVSPRLVSSFSVTAVALAAVVLWPSHPIWLQWSQEVSRRADLMGLALAQGVVLADLDQALAIPAEASTQHTLSLLQTARHDVFREACPVRSVEQASTPGQLRDMTWSAPEAGMANTALHRIEGFVSPAASSRLRLWIYSGNGECRGRGMLTRHSKVFRQLWTGHRNQFDALVNSADLTGSVELQLRDDDILLDRFWLSLPETP